MPLKKCSIHFPDTMSYSHIKAKLADGESVELNPSGSSMVPRIQSKQRIVLSPLTENEVKMGDIVLAKVRGRHYIHLITAIDGERVQISNNRGYVNGWTNKSKIFGIVTEIGE